MMDEDLFGVIIVLFLILAIIIAIIIGVEIHHNKDIEFEKYKIEKQYVEQNIVEEDK